MKLKTVVGEIDSGLDLALEKALTKHGYRRWASGFDLTTDTRDLAFEKRIDKILKKYY